MPSYTIEIYPRKNEFDPLAIRVRTELMEAGQPASSAVVLTRRLYRIDGPLTEEQIQTVAKTLIVDPVIETFAIEADGGKNGKKTGKDKGIIADVWPRPGVADPVGDTLAKGLHDIGYSGTFKTSSAIRYVFPKITNAAVVHTLAKQALANELINDIHIRKT
jgi:phosphoribosylformylglycinamidine (FGAM) synthase PurS component